MPELKYFMIISILITNYFGGSKATFDFLNPYSFFNWGSETNLREFSGKRVATDSVLSFYYNFDTIGLVERSKKNELLRCEFLILETQTADSVARTNMPGATITALTIDEFLALMNDCEIVDKRNNPDIPFSSFFNFISAFLFAVNPVSMIIGIAPGTNWCGKANIAKNYNDLGFNSETDRCCRQHDLCPVKLRPHETLYGITNKNFHVISHCKCDDLLFSCLHDANTFMAHIIGVIYFKILRTPCFTSKAGTYHTRGPKPNF